MGFPFGSSPSEPGRTPGATSNKGRLFALIGLVLGVPLSYYFQPDVIKSKLSLTQYLGHLPEILRDSSGDYVFPVILSCVLTALAGGIVGYFMDQAAKPK